MVWCRNKAGQDAWTMKKKIWPRGRGRGLGRGTDQRRGAARVGRELVFGSETAGPDNRDDKGEA